MKKAISILILLILLFFAGQWALTYFKKGHEVDYQVSYNDKIFDVHEKYSKELDNKYDIIIKNDKEIYYYVLPDTYNKQKKIIKNFEYYEQDGISCIYPILLDEKGSYLQCIKDGVNYSSYAVNSEFINKIREDLKNKGYSVDTINNTENKEALDNSTIYISNLLDNDYITLWSYKGIQIISKEKKSVQNTLSYDKYENNHGYLVDKYYIIPVYLSNKVLEFNKVNIIDIEKSEIKSVELGYTLSSNTYINGVVDNKLYYTDPSNLLQIEINPKSNNSRLIGSKDIKGQLYNGTWQDVNIYDFVNKKIKFTSIPKEVSKKYNYVKIEGNKNSYYFYNSNGEVYQVSKDNIDVSVLLFKANNLNNFKVVDDTIYYVVGDTLYYFNENSGNIPVLKNNELRYNQLNRVDIYRKP